MSLFIRMLIIQLNESGVTAQGRRSTLMWIWLSWWMDMKERKVPSLQEAEDIF